MRRIVVLLTSIAFLSSCHRVPRILEPLIEAPPHPKELHRETRSFLCLPETFSVSPFCPLMPEEQCTDWGKEYRIALAFASDFDLYRAVTGFKRALFLIPLECVARRVEIEYAITLAYYLGKKYVEAVYAVESTELACVDSSFPAFHDLLLILYDSYVHLGRSGPAANILDVIEQLNCPEARTLNLLSAIKCADFPTIHLLAVQDPHSTYIPALLSCYQQEAKSIRKAEILNALLPGAGYWYVGLKETAITALMINTLFAAATYYCFENGNPAGGAILLSLEGGWYFGGIIGGGYAAKYYNERLYCSYAEKITHQEACFPLFMLNYTF